LLRWVHRPPNLAQDRAVLRADTGARATLPGLAGAMAAPAAIAKGMPDGSAVVPASQVGDGCDVKGGGLVPVDDPDHRADAAGRGKAAAAWVGTLVDPDALYSWPDATGRSVRWRAGVDAPRLCCTGSTAVISMDAAPGDNGHRRVTVEELENETGFDMTPILVVGTAGLLSSWPLRLLGQDSFPELPDALAGDYDLATLAGLIRSGFVSPDVYIKWVSDEIGYGLFASADLATRTFIGEYTGVVTDDQVPERDERDGYRMNYPGVGLQISARELGGIPRFVNHSPNPNVDVNAVLVDGSYHMVYVTLTEVKKDSQLLQNYGTGYWSPLATHTAVKVVI